jgi:MFS family permease
MSAWPKAVWWIFTARVARMLAYGLLGVVLVLYLSETGLDTARIGLLLSLTLLGDSALSLWLSTRADSWGRRRTLAVGAWLMAAGGAGMALTGEFVWLLVAATIGVISPTGGEVGPFLAVEQAALAQVTPDQDRTKVFAWYNVVGYAATALGALVAGISVEWLQAAGQTALASYRVVLAAYGGMGLLLLLLNLRLGSEVESRVVADGAKRLLGLGESRGIVLRLSALFSVDSFAGGFIVQSFLVWWFHQRFGVGEAALGGVFFGANLLSGLSALAAVPLAKRIGLVNTMVWTHLPSNVLLMLVPVMPTFGWAAAVLLLRHTISQMDVPTRQSYVNAVVPAGERAAANGVTGTARQLGTSLAPLLMAPLLALAPGAPFFAAGGLKIAYDLALWRGFRSVRPPEESAR